MIYHTTPHLLIHALDLNGPSHNTASWDSKLTVFFSSMTGLTSENCVSTRAGPCWGAVPAFASHSCAALLQADQFLSV